MSVHGLPEGWQVPGLSAASGKVLQPLRVGVIGARRVAPVAVADREWLNAWGNGQAIRLFYRFSKQR